MYLVHAVAPQRLVHCISALPVTSQFITLFPLGGFPSLSTPNNVGYSTRLVPWQMVFHSSIHCISCRLIYGFVSEVVACMHIWYLTLQQRMHVLCHTDQLVTWSIGAVMIRLRWGLGSNHRIYIPTQWNNLTINITMGCLPLQKLIHSFIHTYPMYIPLNFTYYFIFNDVTIVLK